jgi:hypothetical protein
MCSTHRADYRIGSALNPRPGDADVNRIAKASILKVYHSNQLPITNDQVIQPQVAIAESGCWQDWHSRFKFSVDRLCEWIWIGFEIFISCIQESIRGFFILESMINR